MQRTRFLRVALGLACAAALAVPVIGQADDSSSKGDGRTFYATDNQGNLLSFSADNPRRLDTMRGITGLPPGVTLTGIDFRPRTGDLYGIGSDSMVYRVNPQTAIAVSESSTTPPTPSTPALRGRFFGVDFNPMVDRIRVTSDANQNIRLHPDDANVVGADADLNPGDPTIVGSAYTGSSFSAGLASSTRSMRSTTRSTCRARRTTARSRWASSSTSTSAATAGSTSPAGTTSATSPLAPIGDRGRSSTASTSRPATASSSAGSAVAATRSPASRPGRTSPRGSDVLRSGAASRRAAPPLAGRRSDALARRRLILIAATRVAIGALQATA
jgi:hypothetical protein